MEIEHDDHYSMNTPVGWDDHGGPGDGPKNASCVLCEYSDDTGGALDFLKKMDTALGGRTDDSVLGRMMEDTYRTMFFEPLRQRNIEVPELLASDIIHHFTHHDINPLRVLRQDINRLQAIQDVLCPRARDGSGRLTINPSDARQWTSMERMKMDLVRQYEQTDNRTSREMPSAPDLSTI